MARGFSNRGRLPAPKRQIANDGSSSCSSVIVTMGANAQVKAVLSGSSLIIVPAGTLVRTRGMIAVGVLTSGAANNAITGAYGQIVVSSDAATVGISALPGPLSDIENDWYVWLPIALRLDTVAEAPVNITSNALLPYDSRGQRKLKAGDELVSVVEFCQSDITTGTVIQVADSFRQQFKL